MHVALNPPDGVAPVDVIRSTLSGSTRAEPDRVPRAYRLGVARLEAWSRAGVPSRSNRYCGHSATIRGRLHGITTRIYQICFHKNWGHEFVREREQVRFLGARLILLSLGFDRAVQAANPTYPRFRDDDDTPAHAQLIYISEYLVYKSVQAPACSAAAVKFTATTSSLLTPGWPILFVDRPENHLRVHPPIGVGGGASRDYGGASKRFRVVSIFGICYLYYFF